MTKQTICYDIRVQSVFQRVCSSGLLFIRDESNFSPQRVQSLSSEWSIAVVENATILGVHFRNQIDVK